MENKILQNLSLSAVFAALLSYLGMVAVPIVILVITMIVDYITGMSAAWYNAELSSKKGIKGVVKKVGYLALVVVAMALDWLIYCGLQQIGIGLGYGIFFAVIVAIWLIINELISTLENLSRMGVPIPNFLKKIVGKLKTTVESKGDSEK